MECLLQPMWDETRSQKQRKCENPQIKNYLKTQWKLKHSLNQWIKGEITKEIRKYLEMN